MTSAQDPNTSSHDSVPLPGRPVRGSSTGRPIMAALDLLGRRWTLRVLWELREEALGFSEVRKRCDRMSPDTLSTRLGELDEAGIVTRDDDGKWTLTPLGLELGPGMEALSEWAEQWADAIRSDEDE